MKFTDIISPFLAWSRAAKKADTIPYPAAKNPGSERYRGFHINDSEKCIGCGRCADICQNLAISMVRVPGLESSVSDSGLRPSVDYGRCCWCALCIDVCSTASLGMSNSYSWSTINGDSCVYTPGHDQRAWDDSIRGYRQENPVLQWAGSPRIPMGIESPHSRVCNFDEVVLGYTVEQAVEEASRCIECGLCVSACPAHMHVPDYVRAIARGRFDEAVKLFYDNNPLPEMCGKVCTRQCESVCAMGYQGESIAIRWLKRFACEQFESLSEILGDRLVPESDSPGRVAIIGAGPSGLSAAYFLAITGHQVHVHERSATAGGVAQAAIPQYRLPVEVYSRQMEVFDRAGVNFHLDEDISSSIFEELESSFDALYIASGLQKSTEFQFQGSDLPGVRHAFPFLMRQPEKECESPGERVLVIGGGNVAMDTARTCRRLGSNVIVSYRRRIVDMPADEEEIHEALEEEVELRPQSIPLRVESTDTCLRYFYADAEMIPDPSGGRPKPVRKGDGEHMIEADTVFLAIGQSSDLGFIPDDVTRKLNIKWGMIAVDESGYTGVDSIFAGGDITPGAADAITAIADGMRAAAGISRHLKEKLQS